jgi:hypothetical protein
MPSLSATLSATISERMIFSPSRAATPAATCMPREPISLVIATTVMTASCSRGSGRIEIMRLPPLSIDLAGYPM